MQQSLLELRQTEVQRLQRTQDLEQQRGNRLKRASDRTRDAIYAMPTNSTDIAPYLTQMDRHFDSCDVEEDLRSALHTPFLTEKARRATLAMTADELQNYKAWKDVILREHRLTATAYRNQFLNATRQTGESCKQFATRINTAWQYYLEARKVTTYEQLNKLILADRLRDSLHPNTQHYIQDREHNE